MTLTPIAWSWIRRGARRARVRRRTIVARQQQRCDHDSLTRRALSSWDKDKALRVSYPTSRPVIVFTAGAPGSGKTFSLNNIYGLNNIDMMLDLDLVMPDHPHYDASAPHKVYEEKSAYEWANERIEETFVKEVLEGHEKNDLQLVCFDGTGVHVERRKRRMKMAKDAGFWVVNLYVKVSADTAMLRNDRRQRRVPEDYLREYVDKLDDAVMSYCNDPALCDEHIVWNNDEDDGKHGKGRWNDAYDAVWGKSQLRQEVSKSVDVQHDPWALWNIY